MRDVLSHFWNESFGSIYPILKRLHEADLISKTPPPKGGHPGRTLYELTAGGWSALHSWFDDPVDATPPRIELLLKVYFGRLASREVLREQILERRRSVLSEIKQMEPVVQVLTTLKEKDDESAYPYLTAALRQRVYQGWLDWCDEAIEVIDSIESKDKDEK